MEIALEKLATFFILKNLSEDGLCGKKLYAGCGDDGTTTRLQKNTKSKKKFYNKLFLSFSKTGYEVKRHCKLTILIPAEDDWGHVLYVSSDVFDHPRLQPKAVTYSINPRTFFSFFLVSSAIL